MEAVEFYDKNLEKYNLLNLIDPATAKQVINIMEEFAKHIIEINFCDGSSSDFEKVTVAEFKKIHKNINLCVDWVNS